MDRFTISTPDAVLEDLRERLSRTRFPNEIADSGWGYGTDLAYVKALCAYWRDAFDWRAQEAALNRFDQFTTEIGGLRVHFIHVRSKEPGAMPLIISHGWPGSIAEFTKIIGPLTDPAAHGGDPRDAFHVVCPSLPGYGFSEAPKRPGFDIKAMGETAAALMASLGYDRYFAQGGDWGALVSTHAALAAPGNVRAIHLNMPVGRPPRERDPKAGLTEKELKGLEKSQHFRKFETGYQAIQGTKPQTLGYGLTDSPAGLAAWIVEKFYTWGDCRGDITSRFSMDDLLTNIMIYWVTGTITSSTRLYCETMRSGRFGPAEKRVEQPTAVALFPGELSQLPRSWVEPHYNVVRWTEFDRGGHFAAMEEPGLLVGDIRAFFREYRG